MLRSLTLTSLLAAAALTTGCFESHLGTGGGGTCGRSTCSDSETCCRVSCEGAVACQTADLPCPDLFCPDECSGDFDCGGGTVCIVPTGLCGGPGTCVVPPTDCPREGPRVCGCDGSDYLNECVANRMGVSVARLGSCDGELCAGARCGDGEQCCAGCMGEDFCWPGREPCPDIFCPGECFGNEDCGVLEYCALPDGVCEFGGPVPGTCAPRPTLCDDICDGACGCDGNEYCNSCFAAQMGVNVGDADRCVPRPCGRGGRVCDPDEYCDLGPMCGGSDGQSCQPRPGPCPDIFAPACGCDGNTYPNACEANAAGVTVERPGECPPPPIARSCAELLALDPSAPSGTYSIVNGAVGMVRVYCDMTTDGGGWTLVSSSIFEPPDDRAGPYHPDLAMQGPSGSQPWVWNGMRAVVGARADVRFTCRASFMVANDVDLSFYDVIWYDEWTTGSDADSCFSEGNGTGQDLPQPSRRNNLTGVTLPIGTPWMSPGSNYLEGEDSCGSTDDFTVDFQDRGMDSNQADGTDWGEDDGSPKCGTQTPMDGVFQIWVR